MFTTNLTVLVNFERPGSFIAHVKMTVDLVRQAVETMWPESTGFDLVHVYDEDGTLLIEGRRKSGGWTWSPAA